MSSTRARPAARQALKARPGDSVVIQWNEALLQGVVMLQERIQNEGIGNHELEQRWRGEPIVVE